MAKIEVSYKNGFLHGRQAFNQHDEDGIQTVPGVSIRLRVDSIVMYCAGDPGCVEVSLRGAEEAVVLVGSVKGVDVAIDRHIKLGNCTKESDQ